MQRTSIKTLKDLMATLRTVTATPAEYMTGSQINVGYLAADHNAIYGGWVLTQVTTKGGGESMGAMGCPEYRVPARQFEAHLRQAIWATEDCNERLKARPLLA